MIEVNFRVMSENFDNDTSTSDQYYTFLIF